MWQIFWCRSATRTEPSFKLLLLYASSHVLRGFGRVEHATAEVVISVPLIGKKLTTERPDR